MNKAIEVKGLKKSYGRVEAVKGIDFYAEEGKLFAFPVRTARENPPQSTLSVPF